MADEAARSRLGRGLAALMGDVGEESAAVERGRAQRRAPVELLHPNPRNPRQAFTDADLDELAASIRERGIIQPIVVRTRRGSPETYEIIAGERRWRAAQRAGSHDVPIVVLDVSDGEALELAVIENVQRTDLNAVEEAMGYQALGDEFKHSHDEIARIVGKSRSHVANTVRLLKLPQSVQVFIRDGRISAGHARALINVPDPESMVREIVTKGLNVRQVEAMVQESPQRQGKKPATRARVVKDADTAAFEKRLSDALGLAVTLDQRGHGGVVQIRYRTLDQLDDLVRRLGC
jgi:ParB family chromosome partitioning protein